MSDAANHELMTPLTSILLNSEHLSALAQAAPLLRDTVARAALAPEAARALIQILDELAPISTDLLSAARHMRQLLEKPQTP